MQKGSEMTSENFGELRERLLREEKVQQMIRARAYEIYRMRGGQPGGEALDWFQAEGEVLAFLVADESRRADEKDAQRSPGPAAKPDAHQVARANKRSKPRTASKPTDAKQASTKTATKRAASKKSPASKPRPKRTRKETKAEDRQQK